MESTGVQGVIMSKMINNSVNIYIENGILEFIIDYIFRNNFNDIRDLIRMKIVNKAFYLKIHHIILDKCNILNNSSNFHYRELTYYNSSSINLYYYNNISIMQQCTICKKKIQYYNILEHTNKVLCKDHLKNVFVTLSDAVRKYKLPKKKVMNLSRWKHYKKNHYLFHIYAIKTLSIYHKYPKYKYNIYNKLSKYIK